MPENRNLIQTTTMSSKYPRLTTEQEKQVELYGRTHANTIGGQKAASDRFAKYILKEQEREKRVANNTRIANTMYMNGITATESEAKNKNINGSRMQTLANMMTDYAYNVEGVDISDKSSDEIIKMYTNKKGRGDIIAQYLQGDINEENAMYLLGIDIPEHNSADVMGSYANYQGGGDVMGSYRQDEVYIKDEGNPSTGVAQEGIKDNGGGFNWKPIVGVGAGLGTAQALGQASTRYGNYKYNSAFENSILDINKNWEYENNKRLMDNASKNIAKYEKELADLTSIDNEMLYSPEDIANINKARANRDAAKEAYTRYSEALEKGKPVTLADIAEEFGLKGSANKIGEQADYYIKKIGDERIAPAFEQLKDRKVNALKIVYSIEEWINENIHEEVQKAEAKKVLKKYAKAYQNKTSISLEEADSIKKELGKQLAESIFEGDMSKNANGKVVTALYTKFRDAVIDNLKDVNPEIVDDYMKQSRLINISDTMAKAVNSDSKSRKILTEIGKETWGGTMRKLIGKYGTPSNRMKYASNVLGKGKDAVTKFLESSGGKTLLKNAGKAAKSILPMLSVIPGWKMTEAMINAHRGDYVWMLANSNLEKMLNGEDVGMTREELEQVINDERFREYLEESGLGATRYDSLVGRTTDPLKISE